LISTPCFLFRLPRVVISRPSACHWRTPLPLCVDGAVKNKAMFPSNPNHHWHDHNIISTLCQCYPSAQGSQMPMLEIAMLWTTLPTYSVERQGCRCRRATILGVVGDVTPTRLRSSVTTRVYVLQC
jgi:hypothetical protein